MAEVEEETGYKVSVDRLELVKCYVGAVGIAGVHSRVYYVEVTNQDVSLGYCLRGLFSEIGKEPTVPKRLFQFS